MLNKNDIYLREKKVKIKREFLQLLLFLSQENSSLVIHVIPKTKVVQVCLKDRVVLLYMEMYNSSCKIRIYYRILSIQLAP